MQKVFRGRLLTFSGKREEYGPSRFSNEIYEIVFLAAREWNPWRKLFTPIWVNESWLRFEINCILIKFCCQSLPSENSALQLLQVSLFSFDTFFLCFCSREKAKLKLKLKPRSKPQSKVPIKFSINGNKVKSVDIPACQSASRVKSRVTKDFPGGSCHFSAIWLFVFDMAKKK